MRKKCMEKGIIYICGSYDDDRNMGNGLCRGIG